MTMTFGNRSQRLLGSVALSLLAGATLAQSPPPPTQPTDPSAASSPHQRDAVKSPGAEAAAPGDTAAASDTASSNQKQVLKKKMRHPKPAKDAPSSAP